MPKTLVAALREHQLGSPFADEDDLIFANEKGTPLDGHTSCAASSSPRSDGRAYRRSASMI
jgi:hypothetical protein